MAVLTRLRLSAKLENLGRLIGALSDCAKTQGFAQKNISKIELAAEEALVNVFRYAYPEQPGDVEMICRLEGERLAIEIVDSGIPFDATAMPVPEVTDGDHEREPGGLGILLMKKVMDEVRYRREKGRNILTLIIQQD
jgi:anti-sigma regulatory factor (Ser/Thr protein kinase)